MEKKFNEINLGIALLLLISFGFVIYSCVQVNKLNKRIDTTQELIMINNQGVSIVDQEVIDEIHEIKGKLGYIQTTTDQIFTSLPSYIYKEPNDYDGKICDETNHCQRYIFLDDQPYNDN